MGWAWQPSTRPLARSRSDNAVASGRSDAMSPDINSTLQLPHAPVLHSYGNATPARSAARVIVSLAAQGKAVSESATVMVNAIHPTNPCVVAGNMSSGAIFRVMMPCVRA